MQNPKPTTEQSYQTILVVWIALLVSQLMFPFLVFFVKPDLFKFDFAKPLLGENQIIILALAFLSLTSLSLSFVIKKKYLDQAVTAQKVELVQTAMIVGCALCESVSLFGLFLAFSFDYQYFFLFSAAGILGTAFHFPRRESVHAATFKT